MGCTALDAGKVLLGISQVNQAPSCLITLESYLPAYRMPTYDIEFFKRAYAGAEAFGFSESFITFVAESPQFMTDAGKRFSNIEKTVSAYSAASGKQIPADLIACGNGLKAGWSTLETAVKESDKTRKVVEYARLIKTIIL